MLGAVNMRPECAAVRSQFPDGRKGKDLKSSAVCQNRPVPGNEFMETPCPAEYVKARAQIQMIGIAQNDFRTDVLFQIPVIDTFDGPHCADGHENRGLDGTMVRSYNAATGGRGGICMCLDKFHPESFFKRQR